MASPVSNFWAAGQAALNIFGDGLLVGDLLA